MSSKQNYSKLKKNYNIKQKTISAYGEISNITVL